MADSFLRLKKHLPVLGVGLGYRTEIAAETLAHRDSIDFLELITEHFLNEGPVEQRSLDEATEFPKVPHGLELSVGNMEDLDLDYLKKVKRLLHKTGAPWWSDHLCFTGVKGNRLHDLLPLPFSKEAVNHVVNRVKKIQEIVELPLLLENVSSYMLAPGGELNEQQFISEVVEKADCGLLLDVNNVYVNSVNHGFDPVEFIQQIPLERVVQIHIAGHKKAGSLIIDSHGAKIAQPVYDLLSLTLDKSSVKAILLERDQLFPRFSSIVAELDKIRRLAAEKQEFLLLGNTHKDRLRGSANHPLG